MSLKKYVHIEASGARRKEGDRQRLGTLGQIKTYAPSVSIR